MTLKFTYLLSLILIALSLNSQTIYVRPTIGYGFEINTQDYITRSVNYYESNTSSWMDQEYNTERFSFGHKIKFGISVGTEITRNVDFNLSFEYTKSHSPEFKTNSVYTFDYEYEDIQTVRSTEVIKFNCKSFFITPAIVLRPEIQELTTLKPYFKIGAVIGFSSILEDYELSALYDIAGYYPFQSTTYLLQYEKTKSLGLSTGIGLEYKIRDELIVFAEAEYFDLTFTPKSSKKIKSTFMGESDLDKLPYNEVNFEYVDNYQDYENLNIDEPTKYLTRKFSHSNINIITGIRFYIL